MKVVFIIVWALFAFYSLICLGLPEVRPYWKSTQVKMGAVGCFGFALFIWGPSLVAVGILIGAIPQSYLFLTYLLVVVAFIVCMMGFIIDMASSK